MISARPNVNKQPALSANNQRSGQDQGQDNGGHGKGCHINIFCGDNEKCCDNNLQSPQFAEAYSIQTQTIAASPGFNQPGGSILFENALYATSGIDISQAGINGQIKINQSGWYDVAAGITGALNPIPSPLPVFTVSLFQNGLIVPGSTFSNVPLSPAQQSNEITADTYCHFNAGDMISLANTSTAPVFLASPTIGTNAQTNSAYIKLVLLAADSSSNNPSIQAANDAFLSSLKAANLAVAAGTTVNLSQLPADALLAQSAVNALISSLNTANSALLAAVSFATPASYAAASANLASALSLANLSLNAANIVVSTLNPANTAALVNANALTYSACVILNSSPLVSI